MTSPMSSTAESLHPYAYSSSIAAARDVPRPTSDLAVVIPTKDNELVIGSLVVLARRYAVTVIVADDGSTDETVALARELGAGVVSASPCTGRVNAIRAGCRRAVQAGAWAVVILDPRGNNHLVHKLPFIAEPVLRGDADLAIASSTHTARRARLSATSKGTGTTSDSASLPSDPGSTFRALGPRVLELIDILGDVIPDDMDFETAMTTLAARRGLSVAEQPVLDPIAQTEHDADGFSLYRGKRVAVVMPAYNEELLIGETLAGLPDFVARVYVINDCSTDRTQQVIEHCAENDPTIVSIEHETNLGPGAAICTGCRAALRDGMDIVATMDGDNQMDPHFIPELLDPIIDGKCDYTKGNRLASPEYRKGMSRWRFVGNSMLTLLTKIASGYWQLMDPQNGYTAISARALERIDLDTIYPRYGYLNDILVKLNIQGFRVVNVPHPSRYGREKSSIKYSTYIPRVSRLLLRDFFGRLKSKYVVMSFHPLIFYYLLGMLLVAFSVLTGFYALWYRFIEDKPIFVPAITALLLFSIGTLYWLFAMLFDMRQEREDSGWY